MGDIWDELQLVTWVIHDDFKLNVKKIPVLIEKLKDYGT